MYQCDVGNPSVCVCVRARTRQTPHQAPGQPFKFTIPESLDRIKEEFQFLQAQYHRWITQTLNSHFPLLSSALPTLNFTLTTVILITIMNKTSTLASD